VHPWWAGTTLDARDTSDGQHKTTGSWLDALRVRLLDAPEALVGEIGLDGLRGGASDGALDVETQDAAFRAQLRVAADLRRPCTVHCVRAFGRLRDALLAADALHSYGGSLEFGGDLAAALSDRGTRSASRGVGAKYRRRHRAAASTPKLTEHQRPPTRCYFGFSAVVNARMRRDRLAAVVRSVADDAVLLETDLEDGAAIDDHLLQAADLVAEAKGWGRDETRARCDADARAFIFGHLSREDGGVAERRPGLCE